MTTAPDFILPGLPPDEAEGVFLAFHRDGRPFLLRWAPGLTAGQWLAIGFDRDAKRGDGSPYVMPMTMWGAAVAENITSHAAIPIP